MWEYRVTFTDGHVGQWHQHPKGSILDIVGARHKEAITEGIYTIEIRPVQ